MARKEPYPAELLKQNEHGIFNPWNTSSSNNEKWHLKHQMIRRIREINENILVLQENSVPHAELHEILHQVEQLLDVLNQLPKLQRTNGKLDYGSFSHSLMERSPVSGQANPIAPPVNMDPWNGERVVTASVTFQSVHEGPPGTVHGGAILLVFDEILAMAQLPSGQIGKTGSVTVRMLRPTPL